MIIETWVFLIILVVFTAISLISLFGWMAADDRTEQAERRNRQLTEESRSQAEYTYKQQFKRELQDIKEWGEQKDVHM